ncbi:MAG: hypothetical protein K8L99_29875 [Anaerolineae bacterium]|nr:hypothetical protein [Anaerolineae bacterium]
MNALARKIAQVESAPPWGFFTAVNTAFAAFVSFILIGTLFSLALFPNQPYSLLLAWSIGAVLTIIYVNISRRSDREALRLEAGNSRLLIILLVGLAMALTIDLIGLIITDVFVPTPELLGLVVEDPGIISWLIAALFMLGLQPIAEQMVFSGVFFPAARHILGGWGGYIVTVGVYALFHYLVYGYPPVSGLWPSVISPLLAGFGIFAIRANSGSTRAAIVAQIGFGIFALLKLLVL